MSAKTIKRVAVLGAGVMGQGIAAHLANAGIPSVLYDIIPKDLNHGDDRRCVAIKGIENAKKLKPASFYTKVDAALITPANYEDDAALLKTCDLIIEVVVEYLPIKQKVFSWVAKNRRPGSIVASNTSGIPLADMAAGMSDEMKSHFMITHFFNPVRYMRLLELVSGTDTDQDVVETVASFGEEVLGKGIVYAKDTPNFIANRIGTYGIVSIFKHMVEMDMSITEVDAIFGKAMGRAKSAVFRTCDVVGLDTLDHVLGNVYESCPNDEERDLFVSPSFLKDMVKEGALGQKSGKGFYQKTKVKGKTVILARDVKTGEYSPADKPRFASIGAAKKAGGVGAGIKALVSGADKAAKLAWASTADTLIYAANRIPEIADDVVNIDRGMRWGFGWEMGPFETWDAIGVRSSVDRMEAEGRVVPQWVKEMLASGRESFYLQDGANPTHYLPKNGQAADVPMSSKWLILNIEKNRPGFVLKKSSSASILDLGDEILGLEFHGKMNAIDDPMVNLYSEALDLLDAGKYRGLVVGNQAGTAFCAGANLFMVGMAAMQGKWSDLENMIAALQNTLQRAKYSDAPVVTAPYGLTLGGGCEIAMHGAAAQAAGELYMGLVEVGVGLLPAGGGCKEILARLMGDIPHGVDYDPNPFVQKAFENIAMAKVATSAEEARSMGYLRASDRLTLDPDALIADAKSLALGLANGGYKAPRKRRFKAAGAGGRAAIELFLYQMNQGGYATNHDVTVGKAIAHVMTGGDRPEGSWLTEEAVLDLEREGFLKLLGTKETQARIQHMLTTNKPLRN